MGLIQIIKLGLFGYIINGGVKNLTVEGTVSGKQYVGMIAGRVEASALYNCKAIGFVNRTGSGTRTYIGGLAGYTYNSTIIDCGVEADFDIYATVLNQYVYIGGIVGFAKSNYPMGIMNCYCVGDIKLRGIIGLTTKEYEVGGIVGELCDTAINNY